MSRGETLCEAAQQATTQISIVFASVADPIGMELAQSFARPGGNITGVTDLELPLGPKRLQLFKEMIPHLKRVLFAYDTDGALRRVTDHGQIITRRQQTFQRHP